MNNISNPPTPPPVTISNNIIHPTVDFDSLQMFISTISIVHYQCMLAQATASVDIPVIAQHSLNIFTA